MAKHIRFDRAVKVYSVLSLSDMTAQEIDSIFLSREDQIRIHSQIRKDVRAMRRAEKEMDREDESTETQVCHRGLEHLRSPAHLEQHKINRECNVHAVLSEQDRQQRASSAGEDTAENIAEASRRTSEWARNFAVTAGASDAEYVRSVVISRSRRPTKASTLSKDSSSSSAFPRRPRSNGLMRALDLLNGGGDDKKRKHLERDAAATGTEERHCGAVVASERTTPRPASQRHSLAGTVVVDWAADGTIHLPRRLSGNDPAVGRFVRPALGCEQEETGAKTRGSRTTQPSAQEGTATATMLPPL